MIKSLKRFVPVLSTICACSAFVLFIVWCSAIVLSHHRFIVTSQPIPARTPNPETEWITHQGKFFSVSYPSAILREDLVVDTNPSVVERWVIFQSSPSIRIAVEVVDHPDLVNLEESSAVRVRQLKSGEYVQSEITTSGVHGMSFASHNADDQTHEYSAFYDVNHNTISLVVTARNALVAQSVFEKMIASLTFSSEH